MERSQSCSSFILGHFICDNNNNNHNNNNMPIISNNSNNNNKSLSSIPNKLNTQLKLRQAIDLRHTRLQQLYQLHKHQLLTSSSDSLNTLLTRSHSNNNFFQLNTNTNHNVKHILQRQKSTGYLDDLEYAADLEEDGDDESDGHSSMTIPKYKTTAELRQIRQKFHKQLEQQNRLKLKVQEQKQQQQQQQKQVQDHYEELPNSPITPSPLLHSMSTISNSSSSAQSSGGIRVERRLKHEESFDSIVTSNSEMSPVNRRHHFALKRDNSLHSDSSRYSSVDSLLEARKPDPEAILINLGFGPVGSEDILSRIPKRFLKPSQVRGIDTEAFVKRLQLANTLADHSVLGYRGLTGNPDVPPSTIVAKIMERFEVNERKKSMGSLEHTIR